MVDIEKIEKRTVQSYYDDGLGEIALGLILFLLGGVFIAQTIVRERSAIYQALGILSIIVVLSAALLTGRIVRLLKRRITYPRTGYVAFKKKERSPKRRAVAGIVAAIIGASIAVLYGLSPSVSTLFPAVNGLLLAVAVFFFAHKVGLTRFYVLAAASAVIGIAIAAAGIGEIKGIGFFYMLYGITIAISGVITLVAYLHRYPRAAAGSLEGPDAH
jgi:hypothetical protein